MINGKRFFITRVVTVLILTLGFFAIVWYNDVKDKPDFIEKLENLRFDYLYSSKDKYLSDEDLKSTTESLVKVFNNQHLEGNAALVSITPGNDHNIVFDYMYVIKVNPETEKNKAENYFQIQKSRFCANPLDLRRLERLKGYDFIYSLEGTSLVSFTLELKDCAI